MTKLSQLTAALLMLLATVVGCGKEPIGTVATDGLVEVRYVTARVGKIAFVAGESKHVSDKDLLQIQLWIENLSESTKLQYKGWGGDSLASGNKAILRDDLGNVYKPVTFGILHRPAGQRSNESLYPGTSLQDILVFEVPVEKAKLMHLSLPRSNYAQVLDGPRDLELAIPTATFNGGVVETQIAGK